MTIELMTPDDLRNRHPVHVVTMDSDWINEFQEVYELAHFVDGDKVKFEDFYRSILCRGLSGVRTDYLEQFVECVNNPDFVLNDTETPILNQMISDILITFEDNKKENTE